MAGHEDAGVVTGHIGTNTPEFVTPSLGTTARCPDSHGAVQIRVGLELAEKPKLVDYDLIVFATPSMIVTSLSVDS